LAFGPVILALFGPTDDALLGLDPDALAGFFALPVQGLDSASLAHCKLEVNFPLVNLFVILTA
jgi:hypothetical protein